MNTQASVSGRDRAGVGRRRLPSHSLFTTTIERAGSGANGPRSVQGSVVINHGHTDFPSGTQ
jgi:hypothetical protein